MRCSSCCGYFDLSRACGTAPRTRCRADEGGLPTRRFVGGGATLTTVTPTASVATACVHVSVQFITGRKPKRPGLKTPKRLRREFAPTARATNHFFVTCEHFFVTNHFFVTCEHFFVTNHFFRDMRALFRDQPLFVTCEHFFVTNHFFVTMRALFRDASAGFCLTSLFFVTATSFFAFARTRNTAN